MNDAKNAFLCKAIMQGSNSLHPVGNAQCGRQLRNVLMVGDEINGNEGVMN
jgi:hypothetical protein